MKKTLIIFVVLLNSISAMSQGTGRPLGLRFGMQFTPTVSWLSSDEATLADTDGAKLGYSIGVVGDWFFKENYALSTGVFIGSMGGSLTYGNGMRLETKKYGLVEVVGDLSLVPTYVEVPIGFKFLTKQFWRTRIYGQGGYNQYFLVDAVARTDASFEGVMELDKKNVKNEFASALYAFHFGFGAEYNLEGNTYITAGVVAQIGMNDVTQSTSVSGVDPVNKLRGLNFKLGVLF